MIKKITIAIWIVTGLLLGIVVLNYYGNRRLIENYGQGIYQQNEFGALGFTQPYINHFNRGNVFYKLNDFKKARQEYQMALNLKPGDPYDCKIRVNYALATIADIDPDKLTEQDDIDEAIEICETAKSILTENGCATPDNNGHYYAAQKLYNEINDFEESLKNPPPEETPTPTPSPDPEQDPDQTSTPTPTSKPDADATETPTPTPQGTDTPTPTPQGGTDTPTPSPSDGSPTPSPSDGSPTPTDTGTPTPGDTGTPTPTPGGQGTGTPTPTPGGQGTGTPTPTPSGGQGRGTPTPTMTPEQKIKDVQDRSNRDRAGQEGNGADYNHGDSASW